MMENLDKMLKRELQPSKRIRAVALIGLALILALSMVFCVFLYNSTRTTVRAQAVRNLTNICELNEDSLTRALQNREKLLQMLSDRIYRREIYDVEEILDELQDVARNYDCYQAGVIDENKILYRCNGEVVDVSGMELTDLIWDNESHITGSYYSSDDDDYMVNLFSCPVFKDKKVKFVLVSTYYSKDLTDRMNINSLRGKGYTFLLDPQGRVVLTPQKYEDKEYMKLMNYIDQNPEVIPENSADRYFSYNGERYYARFEKLQVNDWYLMTCAREKDVYAEAHVITRSAFVGLSVLWVFIICSLLTAFYASYRFRFELRRSYYYDELLGIGNGNALEVCFQRMSRDDLGKMYLSVMDVDRFKEFNYIYSNDKGDKLLQYIARIFREELDGVYLFRQYDDEFVVLDQSRTDAEVERNVQKIHLRVSRDIAAGRIEPFDISVGIRQIDMNVSLRQLISDASFAREQVKGDHLYYYAFYDGSIREQRISYMEMESNFNTALRNGEFQVYYQPKYDMASGRTIGAEALARWVRPDGTIISPGLFIPCFEASRQIIKLDEAILRSVCRHIQEMSEQGLPLKPVSVNLSRVHLMQSDIFPRLSAIIKEYDINPKWLSFEITESVLTKDNIPLRIITNQLRSLGCRVDMDDYGVGASGPKALASNCFDVIKLDKSFVDDIGDNQVEAVIENTIHLARRLGLEVIAEGVEEARQVERLTELGCYHAQGFYYSKPLPAEAYFEMLKADDEQISETPAPEREVRRPGYSCFSEDFRLALDHSTQPIYIIDPETFEMIYCNEAMQRYLGDSPKGVPCYKVIWGQEEPCENCVARKLRNEGINETMEYHTPGGRWVLVRVSTLQWRGREYYELICLDITARKRMEKELNLRSQEYEAVVRQSTAGIIRYDIATGEAIVNMDENLNRVEERVIPDFRHSFRERSLVDPDCFAVVDEMFEDIEGNAPSRGYDVHVQPRVGDPRWFHMNYTLIESGSDVVRRAVISFYDNTEQREKELAYRRWNTRLSAMMSEYTAYMEVNLSQDVIEAEGRHGVWENASDGRCYSAALERMAGAGIFEEDRFSFRVFFNRERLLGQFMAGHCEGTLQYRTMMEGELLWYRAELQMVSDPGSGDVKASLLISNVDEQMRQQQDLKKAAERDAMTGLYNHAVTETLIRQVMELRTAERCCMLIIDLDDLRVINSTLGHPEGDRALRAIADCMRAQFRRSDIMGRMGGDEFVVLLRDTPEIEGLRNSLAAFMQRLNKVKIGPLDDKPVYASVGAAMGTAGVDTFETLYHQADLALFYVKSMGKNAFHMYVPELEKREFSYKPRSTASLSSLENFEPEEMKRLLQAVSAYCPMVISVNLTQNTYHMLEYESYAMQDHTDQGSFDQLIEDGARSFHPDDRESFLRCFKRENLLAAYERGERLIHHTGRQKGDDGVYRFTKTAVYLMQDEASGDICEIVFSIVYSPEQEDDIEELLPR